MSGWQGASALHTAESGSGSVAYKGMVDCFVRTVREEGWQALFKVPRPRHPLASSRCRHLRQGVVCLVALLSGFSDQVSSSSF